jgi:hypothetical protein
MQIREIMTVDVIRLRKDPAAEAFGEISEPAKPNIRLAIVKVGAHQA